jgi:hypothetical protein
MSQDEEKEFKPGDWVFVVNKRNGEVVRDRRAMYVGEIGRLFLVKVPVMMRQGVEWVVCSFDKEEWGLVKEPE